MKLLDSAPFLSLALTLLARPGAAQTSLLDVSGRPVASWGQVCDIVGDTDGDGFGEFLVGAWEADSGGLADAGSVFLYSGADGSLLATFSGTGADEHAGFGSSAAGDVNGDGFADLCVAADEDNVPGVGANAGSARIFSGRDGSLLFTFVGEGSGDLFGWSTAAVGDVDGDGRDDVLIGSLRADDQGAVSGAGSLSVFSGRDGSLLWRAYGDVLGGQLGSSVGRVGDVNADGHADFAGAQGNLVRVFSGRDGQELWRRTAGGGSLVVSGGIDADGDGFDDWILGAPGVATNTGRVQVISGFDNTLLWQIGGGAVGDQLGAGVVGAGDLAGAGYGDFAAGLPGFDGAAGANTGALRAWSGRTGAELFTFEGDGANDRLGSSLGGFRDVDGDGIPDVVASSVRRAKAKVVSFVPAGLVPFGPGSPGCEGPSTLLAGGAPVLGNGAFELHASNAGIHPILLIGDSEDTPGSFFLGARFHLDPTPVPPALGILRQLVLPEPDGHHSLVAPIAIPNDPALLGQTFVFQVVGLARPGACRHAPLTTSRGLRVTLR